MSNYGVITPQELVKLMENKEGPRVVPVDTTSFPPGVAENASGDFEKGPRIPGSIFFDIDVIKDPKSPYPHMLPDLCTFNAKVSELGVKRTDILVFYDRYKNWICARGAVTAAIFGHPKVYVLSSFEKYIQEGHPLDTEQVTKFSPYPPYSYESKDSYYSQNVITFEEVFELVTSGRTKEYNFFDARPYQRFLGEENDPKHGAHVGHIPGSSPMPFTELFIDGAYSSDAAKVKEMIEKSMQKYGTCIDPEKPFIVTCGSGITACALKSLLQFAGYGPVRFYDGSWSEWSARTEPKYWAVGKDYSC